MPAKMKVSMRVLVRLRQAAAEPARRAVPARGDLRDTRAAPSLGRLPGVARPAYLGRLLWMFAGL